MPQRLETGTLGTSNGRGGQENTDASPKQVTLDERSVRNGIVAALVNLVDEAEILGDRVDLVGELGFDSYDVLKLLEKLEAKFATIIPSVIFAQPLTIEGLIAGILDGQKSYGL